MINRLVYLTLLIFTVLLFSSCGSSSKPRWEHLNTGISGGPIEGLIWDQTQTDPHELFAFSGSKIFFSSNKGLTWETLIDREGTVSSLALIPTAGSDSGNLLVAGAEGLALAKSPYESIEKFAFANQPVSKVFVPSHNPNIILVALESGEVHRSEDGGSNWSLLDLPTTMMVKAFDSVGTTKGSTLIFGSQLLDEQRNTTNQGALFISKDEGKTWTRINEDFMRFTSLAHCTDDNGLRFLASAIDQVWTSTDDAQSWLPFQVEDEATSIESVAASPDCTHLYMATFEEGFFSATLESSTWEGPFSNGISGLATAKNGKAIFVVPGSSNIIFYSSRYGVFRKSEEAESFVLDQQVGAFTVTDMQASSETEPRLWISTWGLGFWSFSFDEKQWNQPSAAALDEGFGFSVHVAPSSPLILAGWPKLFTSSDGTTFDEVGDYIIYAFATDPTDANRIYAASRLGVLVSQDAAQNWESLDGDLEAWEVNGQQSKEMRSIAIDPNDPSHILVGSNGNGILQTTNAGQTWTALLKEELGDTLVGSVIFAGPEGKDVVVAGLQRGVLVSHNSGSTWGFENSGFILPEAIEEIKAYATAYDHESDTLYLASSNGVFYRDGLDDVWTTLAQKTSPRGNLNNPTIVRSDNKVWLFVSSSENGIYRIALD